MTAGLMSFIFMQERNRSLSPIVTASLLKKFKCRSCRFFQAYGGALRMRAEIVIGGPWAPDPACYLTDEEIA